MGSLLTFVKFIWDGLIKFITWFVGIPALVVSSVVGFVSSVSNLITSFNQGGTLTSEWVGMLASSSSDLAQMTSDFPDIVSLACYALSVDTLFTYITSVFALFVSLLTLVFTFFIVTVPAFIIQLYGVKLTAWFITMLFPRGYSITGITALANLNIVTPVRSALKDGKYNPFLSS